MVLYLVALAAQFSSTLLVNDLEPVIVLDFDRYFRFPLQLNSTGFHLTESTIDYYNRRPDVFSIFAEYN